MDPQYERNLYLLLYHLGESISVNKQQVDQFVEKYIDIENVSATGAEEGIVIKQNPARQTIVATTLKIPNLRFRLRDVIFQTAKTAKLAERAGGDWLLLLLLSIEFCFNLNRYSEVELTHTEAEILYNLYRLSLELKTISVDQIYTRMSGKMKEGIVAEALDNLDKLGCIELENGQVKLIEEIYVQSEM